MPANDYLIMKNYSLDIPYRLETIEDITNAMQGDLLGTTDYRRLLDFAKKTDLHQPHAFIKAKKKVTKNFFKIDEKKIPDIKINFSAVASLPLAVQYPLVKERLSWINEVISHEDLVHFFYSFPLRIRERFLLDRIPDSLTLMYSSVLAIRQLIKRDLIVYVKAQKTSTLNLIQLKKSLIALTVFDPRNEEVLEALKMENNGEDSILYQNALTEILFARLPQTIHGLLTKNASNLVQKLSLKMSKLNLSSRHVTNLLGYVNKNMTSDDLYKALSRIGHVSMKMNIPQASKRRLHDYIESMRKNMERTPSVYRTLFLNPELETSQRLYRPIKLMKSEKTMTERTIQHYTQLNTFDFYATKDFFDLIKGKFSSDCTDSHLGDNQLMTPHFFNIRMFKDEQWIGNIYMLDFCDEHDTLIIDRIQLPRDLKAIYHQFFDRLREVLIEIFEDVRYKYILMPLKISNHATIQYAFNEYKKHLSKKEMCFDYPFADHFESLHVKKNYYVLHKRL